MAKKPEDPYAPPPMYHERSGALVRVAIIAALLAVGAWGYFAFGRGPVQPLGQPETAQTQDTGQQLADAGNTAPPEAIPQATPAPPPAAAPIRTQPAPVRHSAPRHESAPVDTTPAPTMSPPPVTPAPAAPAVPTPIPPDATPPTSGG